MPQKFRMAAGGDTSILSRTFIVYISSSMWKISSCTHHPRGHTIAGAYHRGDISSQGDIITRTLNTSTRMYVSSRILCYAVKQPKPQFSSLGLCLFRKILGIRRFHALSFSSHVRAEVYSAKKGFNRFF